jgi:DNA polymerase III gamma/tau subunit
MGDKELGVERIEQMLGLPRSQVIFDLVQAIGSTDVKAVLQQSDKLIQNGLGVETLIASLVEHLRNLLILRSVGNAGDLVETPGLSTADLTKQAEQFEPAILAQDIAVLEELRRLLRQSQAGRALLDATLVRLTLADQFTSVAELLGRLDGSAPAQAALPGVQKKKFEPVVPAPRETPEASREAPREAAAQAPAPPPPPPKPDPTAEPADVPGTWKALLEILGAQSPGLPGMLAQGIYRGMVEGTAVVQYDPAHEWIVKTLERNGKRDAIRDALSRVLRQNVGLRFEIDASAATTADAPAPSVPGRATTELSEAQAADPLLKAVMEELRASVVRIEETSER